MDEGGSLARARRQRIPAVRWRISSNAPSDESASEAVDVVRIATSVTRRDAIHDQMIERLEAAAYPIQDIAEHEREDDVEIVATLATSSVTSQQLDAVVDSLARLDGVSYATWSSRISD